MKRRLLGQNALSSALLVFFGLAMFWFGRELPLGSMMIMGPAYIPYMLAGFVLLLGVVLGARALSEPGDPVGAVELRPLVLILLGVLCFALLLERVGLFAASAAVVLLSALAAPQARLRESLVLAVGLAVFVSVLFVGLLGIPVPVWLAPFSVAP